MVDAFTAAGPTMQDMADPRPDSVRWSVSDGPQAIAAYAGFCTGALHAPPQHPAWVEAWARHCNSDIIVPTLTGGGGKTVLALALEVVRRGPVRIARFAGGSHANGNFPAVAANALPTSLPPFQDVLRAARPDIDIVLLERQRPLFGGIANPLLGFGAHPSVDPALAVDLTGGFDALLERASGKRKRKKHRSQVRKFEAAGGFRRFRATNRCESDRILDAFFAMKAQRFASMGIGNVFADPDAQAFLRDLFGGAAGSERPDFVLHALEVGGRLRAVTGCGLTGDATICDIAAISEDEITQASPGDFLFFENIREACEEGRGIYDFSVGDEPYKRLWCDVETTYRDVALALTARGKIALRLEALARRSKRAIKANPTLWRLVRRLRRTLGARLPPAAT